VELHAHVVAGTAGAHALAAKEHRDPAAGGTERLHVRLRIGADLVHRGAHRLMRGLVCSLERIGAGRLVRKGEGGFERGLLGGQRCFLRLRLAVDDAADRGSVLIEGRGTRRGIDVGECLQCDRGSGPLRERRGPEHRQRDRARGDAHEGVTGFHRKDEERNGRGRSTCGDRRRGGLRGD
jgi:hypothetical protein